MNDGAIIAVVAIVFGSLVVIFRTIVTAVTGGRDRSSRDSAKDTGEMHSQRELFDLAMRLQSRVETLERLLDGTQPEWRGKP